MIIDNVEYKINKLTGKIIKRQKIKLKCDSCDNEWETLHANRLRKKRELDLCVKCKNRLNRKSKNKLKWLDLECYNCKKIFGRYCSLETENKNYFCSQNCSFEKKHKLKYGHLNLKFQENLDAAAYLFGIILGDGNQTSYQKFTTKINIAFDVKYITLIDQCSNVLKNLNIKFSIEKRTYKNCRRINFSLPNDLLKKYGMLFSGNKFKCQPTPTKEIISNINFAMGLINSDGHTKFISNSKSNYNLIFFNNTVESIINSFEECLQFNSIEYKKYFTKGRLDTRTGNVTKDSIQILIGRKKSYSKIKEMSKYILKETKHTTIF